LKVTTLWRPVHVTNHNNMETISILRRCALDSNYRIKWVTEEAMHVSTLAHAILTANGR
jgi:hypothetical protein